MRGKAALFVLLKPDFGITPAYAGKSAKNVAVEAAKQDHPRVCGEKPSPLTT